MFVSKRGAPDNPTRQRTSLIWWARQRWEFLARAFGTDLAQFDETTASPIPQASSFPAKGLSFEKRQWQVKDKECSYTVTYRITRTAAQAPPVAQPQTPPIRALTNTHNRQRPHLICQAGRRWDTTYGRVKLTLENGVLPGALMKKIQGGLEREDAMLELRADGHEDKLKGTSTLHSNQDANDARDAPRPRLIFWNQSNVWRNSTPNVWSGTRWRETGRARHSHWANNAAESDNSSESNCRLCRPRRAPSACWLFALKNFECARG
jgi:hypothetical protein